MTVARTKRVVPLAYQRQEAAEALGVAVTTFDEHIRPHLKCVYIGGVRLWAIAELQRWLDENGSHQR